MSARLRLGRKLDAGPGSDVHAVDGNRVLKLFHPGVPVAAVQHEFGNQTRAVGMGLPVPEAVSVLRFQDRYGFLMQAVDGGNLLHRLRDPASVAPAGRLLADIQQGINACPGVGFPSYRQMLAGVLARFRQENPLAAEQLDARFERLAEGDRLCHGDLHPGNVLVSGAEHWVLDWCDARRGPCEADIARTRLVLAFGRPGAISEGLRARLVEAYLDRRLSQAAIDRSQCEDWYTLLMAARLYEPVGALERKRLAQALVDRLGKPAGSPRR